MLRYHRGGGQRAPGDVQRATISVRRRAGAGSGKILVVEGVAGGDVEQPPLRRCGHRGGLPAQLPARARSGDLHRAWVLIISSAPRSFPPSRSVACPPSCWNPRRGLLAWSGAAAAAEAGGYRGHRSAIFCRGQRDIDPSGGGVGVNIDVRFDDTPSLPQQRDTMNQRLEGGMQQGLRPLPRRRRRTISVTPRQGRVGIRLELIAPRG